MAKLHEILAAESPLMTQMAKTRADLENTFEKKPLHFAKRQVTFIPFAENVKAEIEDQLDLQSTVARELQWISGIMAPAIDAGFQIDEANGEARADILLPDGSILAKDVCATALLRLEHRADELLQLVTKIPTMDPSKGFQLAPDQGEGVYVSRPDTKLRTNKVQEPIVLYPATSEFPAQTQVISKDVVIGKVETIHWSALLTTAQKGEMLERVEKLRVAVKAARSRANAVEVPKDKIIARRLLDYVFLGAK